MTKQLRSKPLGLPTKQFLVRAGYGASELHLGQGEQEIRSLLGLPTRVVHKYQGQYFYDYPRLGVQVDFGKKGGVVRYIYFFREGVRGHQQAAAVTTDGLRLGDHRRKVLRVLGEPDEQGPGIVLSEREYFGDWVKYNEGITLEFGGDEKIDMMTVNRPKRPT